MHSFASIPWHALACGVFFDRDAAVNLAKLAASSGQVSPLATTHRRPTALSQQRTAAPYHRATATLTVTVTLSTTFILPTTFTLTTTVTLATTVTSDPRCPLSPFW